MAHACQANKSGSITSSIFTHMFIECYAKPMRQRVKLEVPLVLVLDSGGGAWPHLSSSFVQAALHYNIYPFYLPAYTTKCLCALDQSVHAEMSSKWKAFKQRWSGQNQAVGLFVALRAAHFLCEHALSPKYALASWSHIGVEAGKPWNRDKLMLGYCQSNALGALGV